MKNNKWTYLIINLAIPLVLLIILCIFATKITEITPVEEFALKINLDTIKSKIIIKALIFILLFLFLRYLYISKLQNNKKELISTSVYGDIPFVFYLLASVILNIRRINLKCKPIPLQFQVFKHNEQFDIVKLTEIKEKDVKYQIDEIKGSTNTINILIGDTYEITKEQIPVQLLNNKTIIINRKKRENRSRFNSNELIIIINSILEKNKKCKEYNLFLFTNPETNRRLYEEAFNTTTDEFVINIYKSIKVNDKCYFQDKKVKIKL